MIKKISTTEKLDIILALELHFQESFKNQKPPNEEINLKFSALKEKEGSELEKKTAGFNLLDPEKKRIWQKLWMEKIRQRGRTQRLDETIHPEQIAEILKNEPFIVQVIIQEKLPDILVDQVATILQDEKLINFVQRKTISKNNVYIPRPKKQVLSLVRQEFLSNFVAFEDLYQTFDLDKLSPKKLGNFIWMVGIREIAIFCRKIKTKEDLAKFLTEFDEAQTKEIVREIGQLARLTPLRVARAENLIKEIFLEEQTSPERIRCLGLRILAMVLSHRDYSSQKFTIQKLPVEIGKILRSNIITSEKEFSGLTGAEKAVYQEFNSEVLELASIFLKDL